MKFGIRKKMFVISIATTVLSFLLILVCFNLISGGYIKKESISELQAAAVSAEMVGMSTAATVPPAESVPSATVSEVTAASLIGGSLEAADVLQKELINSGKAVRVMISDSDETLYPFYDVSRGETAGSSPAVPTTGYFDMEEVRALQSYITVNPVTSPEKVLLNETSYYIMSAPVSADATAVFYKNVQPLEDLITNVNTALLWLLLLCGVITVAASMGLSNGMVRGIRQLCGFAEDIGKGDFRQRDFNLNELELAVLAGDMNRMARQLSDYDDEQKTFFQNVSHELRTPLMSIQGYAEGITAGVFEEEKGRDAANIILNESDRLTAMVEDLLRLSRLDSSEAGDRKELFDCREALKAAVEQGKKLCSDKIISLEIIETPEGGEAENSKEKIFWVEGNVKEFEKAILNIISNGLRYARERITVVCDCQGRRITIADDGTGISEQDLPFVFKRFYKGEDGCTGIGLAISLAVIEKMNGTITAENDSSCGAVFTVSLS